MNGINRVLALVALSLVVASAVLAEESAYDLSTPDKAIQSFFAATQTNDLESVELMLSPKIKELLQSGKPSLKEYVQAWTHYPIVEVEKAEQFSFKGDPRVLARAKIVILVEGKKHETRVTVIKIGDQWLWNEK